ncbi:hypothetical protein Ciccas_011988, partial [Cichlidogyrus casuarinus]
FDPFNDLKSNSNIKEASPFSAFEPTGAFAFSTSKTTAAFSDPWAEADKSAFDMPPRPAQPPPSRPSKPPAQTRKESTKFSKKSSFSLHSSHSKKGNKLTGGGSSSSGTEDQEFKRALEESARIAKREEEARMKEEAELKLAIQLSQMNT